MVKPPEFAEIFELPPVERLQLVEDFRDSLMPREADLPIPEWVVKEARARKQRFDADPASRLSWEEVVRGLEDA